MTYSIELMFMLDADNAGEVYNVERAGGVVSLKLWTAKAYAHPSVPRRAMSSVESR